MRKLPAQPYFDRGRTEQALGFLETFDFGSARMS
jgi:hypothetical protein